METRRITRRQALAAGLIGAAGLAGCRKSETPKAIVETNPAPDNAKTAWIGLTVQPRQFETLGPLSLSQKMTTAPDGSELPQYCFRLNAASYTVKRETDAAVQVLYENGGLLSVNRADLVPVDEAVEFFSTMLAESSQDTFALNSRGWAYYLLGEPAKAISDFDEFLKRTPSDNANEPEAPARWEGLVNRGLVLAEQGRFEAALDDLNEARSGNPDLPIAWVNHGYTRELMGLYHAAVADYAHVCKTTPAFTLAMNNVAWVLATCPDPQRREAESAIKMAKRACEATRNLEGMYLDTLAAAYATGWQFDDAVKYQEKALEDKSFVSRYGTDARRRLEMYRDKKPFRTIPVKG